MRGNTVVEDVFAASCDGGDVVDLEAEGVEVAGLVVDRLVAPVAGRLVFGDDAPVSVTVGGVAWGHVANADCVVDSGQRRG